MENGPKIIIDEFEQLMRKKPIQESDLRGMCETIQHYQDDVREHVDLQQILSNVYKICSMQKLYELSQALEETAKRISPDRDILRGQYGLVQQEAPRDPLLADIAFLTGLNYEEVKGIRELVAQVKERPSEKNLIDDLKGEAKKSNKFDSLGQEILVKALTSNNMDVVKGLIKLKFTLRLGAPQPLEESYIAILKMVSEEKRKEDLAKRGAKYINRAKAIQKVFDASDEHPNIKEFTKLVEKLAKSNDETKAIPMPEPNIFVFQGGGAKGACYPGVVKALDEADLLNNAHTMCGASAGAITAGLLALGYDADQFKRLSAEMNFNDFKDVNNAYLPETANFVKSYALNTNCWSGDNFYHWILEKVGAILDDPYATFADLEKAKETNPALKSLIVIATLTSGKSPVSREFSFESTPNVCIASAIRASMALPAAWGPHRMIEKVEGHVQGTEEKKVIKQGANFTVIETGDTYVDGGVFQNLPMQYVDQPKLSYFKKDQNLQRWHAGIRYIPTKTEYEEQTRQPNPFTLGFSFSGHKDSIMGNDAPLDPKITPIIPETEKLYNERKHELETGFEHTKQPALQSRHVLSKMGKTVPYAQDIAATYKLYPGQIVQVVTEGIGTFDTAASAEQQAKAADTTYKVTKNALQVRNSTQGNYHEVISDSNYEVENPASEDLWKYLWLLDKEMERYQNGVIRYEVPTDIKENVMIRHLSRQINIILRNLKNDAEIVLKEAILQVKRKKSIYQLQMEDSIRKRETTINIDSVAHDLKHRIDAYLSAQAQDKATTFEPVKRLMESLMSRLTPCMEVELEPNVNLLDYAAKSGDVELLNLVLKNLKDLIAIKVEHKEDVPFNDLAGFINCHHGRTLKAVIQNGDLSYDKKIECLKILLDSGADLFVENPHGMTPLHAIFQSDEKDKFGLLSYLLHNQDISKMTFGTPKKTLMHFIMLECLKQEDVTLLEQLNDRQHRSLLKGLIPKNIFTDIEENAKEEMAILVRRMIEADGRQKDVCERILNQAAQLCGIKEAKRETYFQALQKFESTDTKLKAALTNFYEHNMDLECLGKDLEKLEQLIGTKPQVGQIHGQYLDKSILMNLIRAGRVKDASMVIEKLVQLRHGWSKPVIPELSDRSLNSDSSVLKYAIDVHNYPSPDMMPIIKRLTQLGADISHGGPKNCPHLACYAAFKGKNDVVQVLFNLGKIDIGAKDSAGNNILHHLAKNQKPLWDQRFLEILNANKGKLTSWNPANITNMVGKTPMHIMIDQKSIAFNLDMIKAIVVAGHEDHHKNEYWKGLNLAQYALFHLGKNHPIFLDLLEHLYPDVLRDDFVIEAREKFKLQHLEFKPQEATHAHAQEDLQDHTQLLQYFVNHDIQGKLDYRVLAQIEPSQIRALLEQKLPNGLNLLMYAITQGDDAIVRLFENKMREYNQGTTYYFSEKINTKSNEDKSALIYLIEQHGVNGFDATNFIKDFRINSNINPNQAGNEDCPSALLYAAKCNKFELLNPLMYYYHTTITTGGTPAEACVFDKNGNTILHCVAQHKPADWQEIFKNFTSSSYPCNTDNYKTQVGYGHYNYANQNGLTAIHLMIEMNDPDFDAFILKGVATPKSFLFDMMSQTFDCKQQTYKNGMTLIQYACFKNPELAKQLIMRLNPELSQANALELDAEVARIKETVKFDAAFNQAPKYDSQLEQAQALRLPEENAAQAKKAKVLLLSKSGDADKRAKQGQSTASEQHEKPKEAPKSPRDKNKRF